MTGILIRESSICHKPRNLTSHQKLEEGGNDSPLETSEEAWPSRHLDFGLVDSTTMKDKFCCFKLPSCGRFLQQNSETNDQTGTEFTFGFSSPRWRPHVSNFWLAIVLTEDTDGPLDSPGTLLVFCARTFP